MMSLMKTCGAVVLGFGVMATAASAATVRVEVGGIQYDVSTLYTWDSSHNLFVDQVWWRNRDLAIHFAGVVGD